MAADGGGTGISSFAVLWIILKAIIFLAGSIFIGRWISPKVFHFASRFRAADLLLTAALGLCFGFALLAKLIGLAAIVGAFAAGLILDEVHWRRFRERGEHSVEELVKPLVGFLVPIFFVTMGARVDLSTFANVDAVSYTHLDVYKRQARQGATIPSEITATNSSRLILLGIPKLLSSP